MICKRNYEISNVWLTIGTLISLCCSKRTKYQGKLIAPLPRLGINAMLPLLTPLQALAAKALYLMKLDYTASRLVLETSSTLTCLAFAFFLLPQKGGCIACAIQRVISANDDLSPLDVLEHRYARLLGSCQIEDHPEAPF
jgi:hypothetical protein